MDLFNPNELEDKIISDDILHGDEWVIKMIHHGNSNRGTRFIKRVEILAEFSNNIYLDNDEYTRWNQWRITNKSASFNNQLVFYNFRNEVYPSTLLIVVRRQMLNDTTIPGHTVVYYIDGFSGSASGPTFTDYPVTLDMIREATESDWNMGYLSYYTLGNYDGTFKYIRKDANINKGKTKLNQPVISPNSLSISNPISIKPLSKRSFASKMIKSFSNTIKKNISKYKSATNVIELIKPWFQTLGYIPDEFLYIINDSFPVTTCHYIMDKLSENDKN